MSRINKEFMDSSISKKWVDGKKILKYGVLMLFLFLVCVLAYEILIEGKKYLLIKDIQYKIDVLQYIGYISWGQPEYLRDPLVNRTNFPLPNESIGFKPPIVNCRGCNIVIIVVDALRSDHLGYYGYQRNTSPYIDSLSEKSITFINAYAHESYTLATIATLFTSEIPVGHGLIHIPKAERLSDDVITLAEILSENNYKTAAFLFNPSLHENHNLGQGFDVYDDNDEGFVGETDSEKYETALKIMNKTVSWLEKENPKSFFLYLHYRDSHYPYLPPKPFDTLFCEESDSWLLPSKKEYQRKEICNYDCEIRYTDEMIRRLVHMILNYSNNTLVVITADHGEEFFDHGGQYHATTLYEELLRVPLIFYFPMEKHVQRITKPAGLIDLAPTILSVLDIKPPDSYKGSNLFSESYNASTLIAGGLYGRYAIISGNIKYIRYNRTQFHLTKPNIHTYNTDSIEFIEEIYNLSADPYEQNNIITENTELIPVFHELLASATENVRTQQSEENELNEETKKRLIELGYLV